MKPSKSIKPKMIFHLLPNAHLDPVWLWDWREGLNEGIITIRTILDLMDEFPELTFIRGESSIYQHIEENDPVTFDRLSCMVEKGRWDIVGGTYNQPDTNLAATETLCRQYEVGQAYFRSRFRLHPEDRLAGRFLRPHTGPAEHHACLRHGRLHVHAAQSPGLSDGRSCLLVGMRLQRSHPCLPAALHRLLQRASPTCHAILDTTLKDATPLPLQNVAVLMGLGNHGGGPSRRHIEDVRSMGGAAPRGRGSLFHFPPFLRRAEKGSFHGPLSNTVQEGRPGLLPAGLLLLGRQAEIGLSPGRVAGRECGDHPVAGSYAGPLSGEAARRNVGGYSLQFLPRYPARLQHRTRHGRPDVLDRQVPPRSRKGPFPRAQSPGHASRLARVGRTGRPAHGCSAAGLESPAATVQRRGSNWKPVSITGPISNSAPTSEACRFASPGQRVKSRPSRKSRPRITACATAHGANGSCFKRNCPRLGWKVFRLGRGIESERNGTHCQPPGE